MLQSMQKKYTENSETLVQSFYIIQTNPQDFNIFYLW